MKIQCENCGTQHELDPPSWVVSSGRAFRFRCSACGHSQSVQPDAASRDGAAFAAPTEVPAARVASPASPPDAGPPEPAHEAPPTVSPPALIDSLAPAPERGTTPASPPGAEEPAAETRSGAVYLKQNGQIYMVRDWETLKRWIVERRVDENDLVSEGGVRWEPIGSHSDLAPLFRTGTPVAAASRAPLSAPPASAPTPFPFGGDAPFSGGAIGDAPWTDDDTEGIPTGLPPLPTEDSVLQERSAQALPPATPEGGLPAQPSSPPARADGDLEIAGEDPEPGLTDSPGRRSPAEAPRIAPLIARPSVPGARGLSVMPPRPSVAPAPLTTPETVIAAAVREDASDGWDDLLAQDGGPHERPREPAPADPRPQAREPVATPPRDPYPFDLEWAEQTRFPPRIGRVAAAIVATLTVVVATAVVLAVFVVPRFGDDPPPPEPSVVAPEPLDVVPEPDPIPLPEPVRVTPPAADPTPPAPVVAPPPPAPAPAAPVEPAPAPDPAPEAAPERRAPSSAELLAEAWRSADAEPAKAEGLFDQVLAKSPSDEEALYGKGYTLLLQGKNAAAAPYLCRVRSSVQADIRQDATGMIASHQLPCTP